MRLPVALPAIAASNEMSTSAADPTSSVALVIGALVDPVTPVAVDVVD